MFSGLDYGVFNISLLTREATEKDPLERACSRPDDFSRSRTLRWSFWLCEDLLDPVTRRRERQIFTEFRHARHLASARDAGDRAAAAGAQPARDRMPAGEPTRRRASAFGEITSVAFEIPYTVARTVYSREQAWRGDYQGFVGAGGRRAVAIVAMVAAAGAMGVYSLATAARSFAAADTARRCCAPHGRGASPSAPVSRDWSCNRPKRAISCIKPHGLPRCDALHGVFDEVI